MNSRNAIEQFRIRQRPNYVPQDDEDIVFRVAFDSQTISTANRFIDALGTVNMRITPGQFAEIPSSMAAC